MAATVTLNKLAVAIKLEDDVTSTGATKTVSISLGNLNKDAFDADKAMNIVNLLVPCLEKDLYAVVKTDTSYIRPGN